MRRTQKQLEEEMVRFKVYQENDIWYGFKECSECGKEIIYEANESYYLLRNIRNSIKKNCLCISCKSTGERNPFFGKKHSEESKKKSSLSKKGRFCGSENAMAKPEHRKRVSEALKEKYASGELDFLKKIQRENAIKNQANGKLKYAPISEAEKELRKKIEELGYTVESQFGIGSLKYDLYLKEYNVLVEYNGDYWHCNPNKYNSDYFNKKKGMFAWQLWEQDQRKKELAEKNGYKLFIIWEADYKFNKENEIDKIIKNL